MGLRVMRVASAGRAVESADRLVVVDLRKVCSAFKGRAKLLESWSLVWMV